MTGIVTGAMKIAGSFISGSKRKKASKKAQAAYEKMQREAIAASEKTQATIQQNLQPYSDAGKIGLNKLTAGMTDADFLASFKQQDLAKDDGYQFRLTEGQRALDRGLNARSGAFSGRQMLSSIGWGQKMATEEYDRARARFNEDRDARYAKTYGLASLGERAVTGVNSSLSDLNRYTVSGLNNIGTAQAQGISERGLIGAQMWSNAIDGAIGMIKSIPGLPGNGPGGISLKNIGG